MKTKQEKPTLMQIRALLTADEYRKLKALAGFRGVSLAELVGRSLRETISNAKELPDA